MRGILWEYGESSATQKKAWGVIKERKNLDSILVGFGITVNIG